MDYIVKAYKDWRFHSQFHEIVPDMDEEYMFNEKQSIRDSARQLKKYGSTCFNQIRNNETLIRHDVEKTDTLQGIALKYGCTTEQIRRANRLFASDSLFLRQFLLIPVEKSSPYYPNTNYNGSDSLEETFASSDFTPTEIGNQTHSSSVTLPTRPFSIAGETLMQANSHEESLSNQSTSSDIQSKSLDSVAAMSTEDESRKCINDFLNKIDNTISQSRKYVEKSKEMIASQSDNDLFGISNIGNTGNGVDALDRQRHNNYNNRANNQNHMRYSSTGNSSDMAHLLNTTQTRRVKSSTKKMEKQQDEYFEL